MTSLMNSLMHLTTSRMMIFLMISRMTILMTTRRLMIQSQTKRFASINLPCGTTVKPMKWNIFFRQITVNMGINYEILIFNCLLRSISWWRCWLDWSLSGNVFWIRRVHRLRVHWDCRWKTQYDIAPCENWVFRFNWLAFGRKFCDALFPVNRSPWTHEYAGHQWPLYCHQTMPVPSARYNRLN